MAFVLPSFLLGILLAALWGWGHRGQLKSTDAGCPAQGRVARECGARMGTGRSLASSSSFFRIPTAFPHIPRGGHSCAVCVCLGGGGGGIKVRNHQNEFSGGWSIESAVRPAPVS